LLLDPVNTFPLGSQGQSHDSNPLSKSWLHLFPSTGAKSFSLGHKNFSASDSLLPHNQIVDVLSSATTQLINMRTKRVVAFIAAFKTFSFDLSKTECEVDVEASYFIRDALINIQMSDAVLGISVRIFHMT
jgi:hypothetical protein